MGWAGTIGDDARKWVAESAKSHYRRKHIPQPQEKRMAILVGEADGKPVVAFNVNADEVQTFLEDEPGSEGRPSDFRIATDAEAQRWEASRSRSDMSSESCRWFAKL
jgi:hypothetical protein